jgi:nucleotide-binding universal stress UspA family protein
VDFSAFSAQALARACDIGGWFGAQVTALHVCPDVFAGGPEAPCLPVPAATMRALREQGQEELLRLVEPFRGRGVALSAEVREGDPWRAILEQAADLPADLVVMGTHGRTGLEHLLLGSVTEKVLRRAACPVLTVGSPPPVGAPALFRRIVCAVDLSEHSRQTIDTALAFALETDAAVTLLHVVHAPLGPAVNSVFRPLPGVDATLPDQGAEALESLRSLTPGECRDWCQLSERASAGTPWREILAVADERKADLVVMGAHGHGPLGERVFGSTTSQVVRRSACPVLVVRRIGEPVVSAEAAPARRKAEVKPRRRELVAT